MNITPSQTNNNFFRVREIFEYSQLTPHVRRLTLEGGKSEGIQVIEIDNKKLKVWLLPQRGMGIWKAWIGETEIGWNSPVQGPVHPSYVPIFDPSGLGWLEGFDELLCRCGLESNGAPEFDKFGNLKYPLHGRIANLPAHDIKIEHAKGDAIVTGIIDETRFHFQKLRLTSKLELSSDSQYFAIHDAITNLSSISADCQMLYHLNLGAPILGMGTKVIAPVHRVVPRNTHAAMDISNWSIYQPPTPGDQEKVYFLKLHSDTDGKTIVLLKNSLGNIGVSVSFTTSQLPCFVLWKNTASTADGYVTGIEPSTNFPNPRSYEKDRQRVITLNAGETCYFDLKIGIHTSEEQVNEVEEKIYKLQAQGNAIVEQKPLIDWCIDAFR